MKKLFLSVCYFLFTKVFVLALGISGPTCAVPGTTVTYTISGTWSPSTKMDWTINGGVIAGTSSTFKSGTPLPSISVTWNSNFTNGSVQLSTSNPAGSATLNVSSTAALTPGTITTNLTQNINYAAIPADIIATPATGGNCTPSYSYQWQQSANNVSFSDVTGATNPSLSFSTGLTATTYYRRKVTENATSSTAYTSSATVSVYPQLIQGTVTPASQTINYAQNASTLTLSAYSGGTGTYTFSWQNSADGNTWNTISGATTTTYTPLAVTSNTYYRGCVISNGVTACSNGAVVNVYPQLIGGSVNPILQNINYGTAPTVLTLSGVSGGNSTYTYQWQSSSNSTFTSPVTITGATSTTYTPGNLTATTYFRVAVTSNGVTVYSAYTTANVYPQLLGGSISPSSLNINYNTSPGQLSLTGVSGGNGTYTYQWQSSSTSTFTSPVTISGATLSTYTPGNLTTLIYYRVAVTSNGVTVYSNYTTVNVYPQLVPGSLSPATSTVNYNIASPTLTLSGVSGGSGSYTYTWQSSTDNIIWNNISGAGATTYTSGLLPSTTYYRVGVTSNGLTLYSTNAVVNVNPRFLGGVIVPAFVSIPSGNAPGIIAANAATGGGCSGSYNYQWQSSTDGITFNDITGATGLVYTPPALTATIYYRRKATCGTEIAFTENSSVKVGPDPISLNFIRAREINKPLVTDTTTAGGLTNPNDVNQITQYFDGLGRKIQTVIKQFSPLQKDVVIANTYDAVGREYVKSMPYVTTTSDGNFKSNATGNGSTFNSAQFPGEQFYYTQTTFEASPLNRVNNTMAPGLSWAGSSRSVTDQYLVNSVTDSVRYWTISAAPGSLPVTTSGYQPNTMYKNVTTDEHSHQIIEYSDLDGKLILKKTQLATTPGTAHVGWLNTYYVYDDFDNLRFVIQPRAVELINANWVVTQAIADELCFRYEYDERKKQIVKKIPGAAENRIVYDKWDRLILSQDGNMRTANQWLFTKYDILNRLVMTGIFTDATHTTQSSMQAFVYAQNMGRNETVITTALPLYTLNQSFPSEVANDVQSMNYYDDYNWTSFLASIYRTFDNSYNSSFNAPSNTVFPYAQTLANTANTRGLITGSMSRVPNVTVLASTNFYDDHYRLIQTKKQNTAGGCDINTTQFGFAGDQLMTLLHHDKPTATPVSANLINKITYDHVGRPLTVKNTLSLTVNGQTTNYPEQLVSTHTYNELSQIQNRQIGNNIENLAFDFNIRGWLKSINKNYVSGSVNNNFFGMEFGYDKTTSINTTTSYVTPQFNGNIAGTIWRSAGDGVGRKYDYLYDNANRLTAANFVQNTSGSTWDNSSLDFTVSNLSYDANGNIMSMNQKGFKAGASTLIDQLSYQYQNSNASNKLSIVNDGSNDPTSKLGDFHYSGTKQSTDYGYDASGNIIGDNNKGISAITYNYLNFPLQMTITGKGTINYVYDALGNKLSKTVVDNTVSPAKTTLTTYMAGFVYEAHSPAGGGAVGPDTLRLLPHPQGRIRWAYHKYLNGTSNYGAEYDYFIRDHLGNTRVVLTQQKDTAQYLATMEAAYRNTEKQLFHNLTTTSYARSLVSGYPVDLSVTNPNDSVIKLNGSSQRVGPNLLLKVMSGDKVDMAVQYYFNSTGTAPTPVSSLNDVLNSLADGLVTMTGGAKGTLGDFTNPAGTVYSALNNFLINNDPTPPTKPKAYLNWMLLDEQLRYVSSYPQSGALPVLNSGLNAGALQAPLSYTGLQITKSGYLYVWVSNETPNTGWDVYFDNLSVKHYTGPLLEETHYYPFGLTMAAISSKALKTSYAENKFRYNGSSELNNGEFSDGTGLDLYETDFRSFDPQLGRFWQPDPLSELFTDWAPYAYAKDNPILMNDPLGLAADSSMPKSPHQRKPKHPKPKYKWLEEVIVTAKKKDCQSCGHPTITLPPPPQKPPPLNWMNWPTSDPQTRDEWHRDHDLYLDRLALNQPLIQGNESWHYLHSLDMYKRWTQADEDGRKMQLGAVGIIFGPWIAMEMASAAMVEISYQGGTRAVFEDIYIQLNTRYNAAISDAIYAVRYGLASRLTVDQIIRLEKLAEKSRDLYKVLTPKNIERIGKAIEKILKHHR